MCEEQNQKELLIEGVDSGTRERSSADAQLACRLGKERFPSWHSGPLPSLTQIIVTNQFLVKSSEWEPAASRGLSLANDVSQREMLLTSQEADLPMVTPLLLLPGFLLRTISPPHAPGWRRAFHVETGDVNGFFYDGPGFRK